MYYGIIALSFWDTAAENGEDSESGRCGAPLMLVSWWDGWNRVEVGGLGISGDVWGLVGGRKRYH